ncbi:Tat pathway signal sequence domain protein, partial [candidate division KSB1 bacterium]
MTATILKTLTFIACCAPVWQGITENNDPLLFPVDDYTVETRTVRTAAGEKQVTLHSYRHIPYVAKPIDRDYQSLDVTVPVAIDGIAVDAVDAPILFNIGVGGYLSVKNTARERDDGRGTPPSGRASGRGPGNPGTMSSKPDLALAAGYVVVSPGCRGRDNRAADGAYYGKAPAAIVDLKAAVRYLRHNRGVMSGNTDWIVSTGCSAGGALSALLGASGNSPLYGKYLQEIGAADEDDAIYASACYSPITDLEHSDMSYEWMYGSVPTRSGLVDQELSRQLRAAYAEYQESLQLAGRNGFGILRADNFDAYLLQFYLIPSANKYLNALADEEREKYL